MTFPRAIFILSLLVLAAGMCGAEEQDWVIRSLTPQGVVDYDLRTGQASATNGVMVTYSNAVLTAERATVDRASGWVVADGSVRVENEGQIWVGEHLSYNFKTRMMRAEQFRTGKTPVFIAARDLVGDTTNKLYYATNALVTVDDSSRPFETLRASWVKIVPGVSVTARNAVLYVGGVPVFYVPYYSRPLNNRANYWDFMPGYRNTFGSFLLSTYNWFWGDDWQGKVHLDYRTARGPATGLDTEGNLGRWGTVSLQSYYLHDKNPEPDGYGGNYPNNRGVAFLGYQSEPYTNLLLKSQVRYQSDADVTQEFMPWLYEQDPQPSTYFDLQRIWPNMSLEAYVQPRINNFLQTVERLPDISLTAYPQQVGKLPLSYQSVSSVAFLDQLFAVQPTLPTPASYEAVRADSWHQISLPQTLFGWLNVEPRVGGRLTYYSPATGMSALNTWTNQETRWVFNTGVELNFKLSRAWPGVSNKLLDVDGLRHIIQPWVNYAYVPNPSVAPPQVPQFDYLMPSLYLLPVEFPGYNAVDQIGAENLVRLGINNKVQTKRTGTVDSLFNWALYTDYFVQRPYGQTNSFSDIFSEVAFKPRSWLVLESLSRFNPNAGQFDLASETVTLTPNNTWSLGVTYFYLQNNYQPVPTAWGQGSQVINTTFYYRFSQNWGIRIAEYYDIINARLANQTYSLYHDFRSWTGAFTTNIQNNGGGNVNWSVGFTLSLKAHPQYHLGQDMVGRYGILPY